MTSPIETIADALIAFILSLLRDPEAAAGFAADPDTALETNNLRGACMADVAAVRPVIVDRPDVVTRTQTDPPPPPSTPTEVTNEIMRIVQQFTTIDARSTTIDQSVNQNIWTEGGDVTQVFDQEAIVASGDGSVAAGEDGQIANGDTDITVGDVSIGNETNDGSFNGATVGAKASVGRARGKLTVIGAGATVQPGAVIGPGLHVPRRRTVKAGQEDRKLPALTAA